MFYKLPDFNYYRPKTLKEALILVSELNNFKILAGGTDLIIDMRIKRYVPRNIIDISSINELKYIVDEGDRVRIGALT
ncbi:MAG TPA: xanthine dehydrogenase family protein subunit M, partial [Acidilobales archaeon]|nr:xanthine dehydrogenase family protein subunit M [Acidilobales archaeon]